VHQPPAGLNPWSVQLKSSDPPAQRQIRAGQERSVSGKKVCLVDSDGVTHCLISDIRLVGSNAVTLKVIQPADPNVPRQVRLYLQGDLRSSTGSDAIRLCAAAVAADAPAPACPGAEAQLTILFTPRGTSTTDALLRVQMPGYSPDHCVQLIRPLGVLRTGRVVAGVCNWSQPV